MLTEVEGEQHLTCGSKRISESVLKTNDIEKEGCPQLFDCLSQTVGSFLESAVMISKRLGS